MILTTSQAEQDVLRTYRLSANAYVTKPVRSIEEFWLEIVKLSRV